MGSRQGPFPTVTNDTDAVHPFGNQYEMSQKQMIG